MTVIPFPRRVPAPKEVAEFKRVCDDQGLELRDEPELSAAEKAEIEAQLGIKRPEPVKERVKPGEV